MEPGETRTIRLKIGGESSYRIEAVFTNGKKIRGDGDYIENGYNCTDVVGDNKIVHATSVSGAVDEAVTFMFVVLATIVAMVGLPVLSWILRRRSVAR